MSTINIDQLVQNLESGVESLAKTSLQNYENEAKTDGNNVINTIKIDLEEWTKEAADGSLTMEDVAYLIKEEEAFDEMVSLKQAGLTEVRIDKFKNDLIDLIVNTVFGAIKL